VNTLRVLSAEEEDILLVKVDWDGDLSARYVDLADTFEVWRVDGKGVKQILRALLEGVAAWRPQGQLDSARKWVPDRNLEE